jgi:hypothetical protein
MGRAWAHGYPMDNQMEWDLTYFKNYKWKYFYALPI